MSASRFEGARTAMVLRQLQGRGVRDPRVLEAMGRVPRERFVQPEWLDAAYEDQPLPIGEGQSISQPWMVARICELLELGGSERVLDVGAGSGYQSAVLALLSRQVVAVERSPRLAQRCRRALADVGLDEVIVVCGDGSQGRSEFAPYDAIACAAAAPRVPAPLTEQLADGGRLVLPIGGPRSQTLVRVRRRGARLEEEVLDPCHFVPLLGRHGYREVAEGEE